MNLTNKKIRTRFAPSPTGYMHIGNLRTALYAYLFAKSQNGDFILRIEDTDRARYVADAVEFIENTLKLAKIYPDEGPHNGGDFGPYVQSERKEIYKKYAEELVEKNFAYYEESDNGVAIRQRMPKTGETTFFDVLHGNITIANEELEDQILLKSDGMPTYNFANVIDDHLMEITHIIRGAEFITSTPKHVLLYQYFGWELPTFIHLAPVMGKAEDGSVSKLSKRHGATSFGDLVDMGYLPEAITNYVALLGWNPKNTNQEIFSMDELINAFSLDGLSKSPAVFDYDKLNWMSGEYFKKMSDEDFASAAEKFLSLDENLSSKKVYLASLLKPRISKLNEIQDTIKFLMTMPNFDAELFINKRNKVNVEKSIEILTPAVEMLKAIEENEWTIENLNEKISAFTTNTGLKVGTVMWPLRIAISMQKVTPGGVTEILYLLGKKISLERMQQSLDNLKNL
ncbi:MAG: glutamate--tRNA ligase [Selenomonadaceae bacterium]|nr:glutamate--tRNA ligase [Selenomonadaceae bacterium]